MMQMSQTLGAAGNAPWLPVNRLQVPPVIDLAVTLTATVNLTYKAQYTCDPLHNDAWRYVSISRTTTTATVTDVAHQLASGDSVFVRGTQDSNLDRLTAAEVTVTGVDTYTYVVANSGAAAGGNYAQVLPLRVFDHATMTGQTAKMNASIAFPVTAVRLVITAYTSGKATLTVTQGMGH